MKKTLRICYEKWDNESIEAGDTDDRGIEAEYEIEPDKWDIEEYEEENGNTDMIYAWLAARTIADNAGCLESSCYPTKGANIWYYSVDPEIDAHTGEYTYYSYHLSGFNGDEEMEVYHLLSTWKVV